MGEHDNGNYSCKKHPDIPSNYVSLLQLKQRKEKEKQAAESLRLAPARQLQLNEETRSGIPRNYNLNHQESTETPRRAEEIHRTVKREEKVRDVSIEGKDGKVEKQNEVMGRYDRNGRGDKRIKGGNGRRIGGGKEGMGVEVEKKLRDVSIGEKDEKVQKENEVGIPRNFNLNHQESTKTPRRAEVIHQTVKMEKKVRDVSIEEKDGKLEKQNEVMGRYDRNGRGDKRIKGGNGRSIGGGKEGMGVEEINRTMEVGKKRRDVSIGEKDGKVEKEKEGVGRRGSEENTGCNRDGNGQKKRNGGGSRRTNGGDGRHRGGKEEWIAVVESDRRVEVEQKLRDVSIGEKDDTVKEKNEVVGHRGREGNRGGNGRNEPNARGYRRSQRGGKKEGMGMEESDRAVEFEKTLGDISIEDKDDKVEEKKEVVARYGRGQNTGYNRDVNGRNGRDYVRVNGGDGRHKAGRRDGMGAEEGDQEKNLGDVSIEEKDEKMEEEKEAVGCAGREENIGYNRDGNGRNGGYGMGKRKKKKGKRVKEGDGTVEVGGQLLNVSIEDEDKKVEEQNKVVSRHDSKKNKNRGYSGGSNWRNGSGYRGVNSGHGRQRGGGYGSHNIGNGGDGDGYGMANLGGRRMLGRKEMVWVKKGEVGDGGAAAAETLG